MGGLTFLTEELPSVTFELKGSNRSGGDGKKLVHRCLGPGLFAAGFLMISWSEVSLGKQFSIQVTVQENYQLMTDGPYRFLRHPRYPGAAVADSR